MLNFEYEEVFHKVYQDAISKNPEIANIRILVNTHCQEGVEVGKGNGKELGSYRISCHGDDEDPNYTISGFALGLAMIIYDVKYGEFDYFNMSKEERHALNEILHSFYRDSDISIKEDE